MCPPDSSDTDRPQFNREEGSDRPRFNREGDGERRPFDRPRFNRESDGERRPFDRPRFNREGGERRDFNKPRFETRRENSYGSPRHAMRPAEPRRPAWERDLPPEGSENWLAPWVQLKYFSYNPAIFPRMIGGAYAEATPGSLVNVYDKNGEIFGGGFWNPTSKTPLRIMHHSKDPITEDMLDEKIRQAVRLRRQFFELDKVTNAYRILHGDSDGIGGLIVDKFDDVLSLEVSTLGTWMRLPRWLPLLHELCGTTRHKVSCDESIARMEGIDPTDYPASDPVRFIKVKEYDTQFEINFLDGHKTGFFCDQRDNRRKLSTLVEGKSVLDLCCYTGGFSIQAKLLGNAAEVTGVDLDEKAIALAKRNANINNAKVNFVHADAYTYARQMIRNGELFDVVLLDPPKFVHGRDEGEYEEGLKKYQDLNMLGLQCVKPGGLFVTCSCSGLVTPESFEQVVIRAAQRQGRKLRIFDITGPGADHPYLSTYPEGRYLKVLWAIAE